MLFNPPLPTSPFPPQIILNRNGAWISLFSWLSQVHSPGLQFFLFFTMPSLLSSGGPVKAVREPALKPCTTMKRTTDIIHRLFRIGEELYQMLQKEAVSLWTSIMPEHLSLSESVLVFYLFQSYVHDKYLMCLSLFYFTLNECSGTRRRFWIRSSKPY